MSGKVIVRLINREDSEFECKAYSVSKNEHCLD